MKFKKTYKISKESLDKVAPTKFCGVREITDDDVIGDAAKMLENFIYDAYKVALHEDIKANSVMINKRFVKVNRFSCSFFDNSYNEFPPLICGLEAYVTDELPDEYAFAVVEAPTTQREAVFEEGRKTGYMEAMNKIRELLLPD